MPRNNRSTLRASWARAFRVALGASLILACKSTSESEPGTPVDCDGKAVVQLAPGEAITIAVDAAGACARLAADPAADAEYLLLAFSANGQEQFGGAKGAFSLFVGPDTFATPSLASASLVAARASFHDRIRRREASLVTGPARPGEDRLRTPPVVLGDKRTFQVCAELDCLGFVAVNATARYVGTEGVVFLDDTVPSGGYTQAELDSVGSLFDNWLYPVDTTAFGRESDVDGNGQVLVLLTDQLNRLSGNCNSSAELVVGYFFGLDLLDQPGSNQAEVFYGMVPDPTSATCTIDHALAKRHLAPVFIHEFQHMISFNRHVLLSGGDPEEVWLNEGLSHFAEELGGRQIPPALCLDQNCVNQFVRSDILNAYDYLLEPELYYLVEPGVSFGTLPERGANWLFVRWLADQAGGDSILGTAITRRLLGADLPGGINLTGAGNVEATAGALIDPGVAMTTLLGEWHAANYLEGRTELAPAGRLYYRSWNLPNAFGQLVFGPYPFQPDSTGGSYRGTGQLLGGSGRTVRLTRRRGSAPIAVGLTATQLFLVQPHLLVRRVR